MKKAFVKILQTKFCLGTACERLEITYLVGKFSSIKFTINYERLNSFYIRNIILPNAVLLALSSLTFFLPSEIGERVGFGVTVTLALCVNLIIVIDFVPETSKTIPNICNYFLISIFLSGFSIFLATISINVNFWTDPANCPKVCSNKVKENRRELSNSEFSSSQSSEASFSGKKRSVGCCCGNMTRREKIRRFMKMFDIGFGTIYFVMTTCYTITFILLSV